MKKSLLSVLLTGIMLLGLTVPAMAAENTGFTDVAPDAWYAEAAIYCRDHGIMGGMSETTFAPNVSLTRSMLAAVLYRMAGAPAVSATNPFTDVADGAWYTDAILWARQNGIVWKRLVRKPCNSLEKLQKSREIIDFTAFLMVDSKGIEPSTSAMRTQRSPS